MYLFSVPLAAMAYSYHPLWGIVLAGGWQDYNHVPKAEVR